MRTIWKFLLLPDGKCRLPQGAQTLSVHEQWGEVCLWALVDPAAPLEDRQMLIYGTGHNILVPTENLKYLGTVLLDAGSLVFHVFELIR
jgi:hypothetical protein